MDSKQTQWDAIWINATLVTCEAVVAKKTKQAIAVKNGKIAWLGGMDELTASPERLAATVYDASNHLMTPGFIDCHTHLVYGGNRAHEFAMRLHGKSYEEIAKAGGGIRSTVKATRAASEEELLCASIKRAYDLFTSGVTTLEIKSGYGLDRETELKMLRVAKRIAYSLPITVKTTYLGAHTLPPEYERTDDYINFVCEEMIPLIAEEKLADAVDVFCEKIAFDLAQTKQVFQAAEKYQLRVKCHAEQLSSMGSVALAAQFNALSVDHLEYVSDDGLEALRASGTIAVLLPGAYYFLREKQVPPVERLRELNIPIAIASDCNPGTSPVVSILSVMNLACTLFRLTPEEALLGVTYHAAKALDLLDQCGSLTVGKTADFVLWDVQDPAELVYYLGHHPARQIIKTGKVVNKKELTDAIECN